MINEHKALKFAGHNLLGFTQVSSYALERSSDATRATTNFLTALILHTVQEAGLMVIHVLNQQFRIEGLTSSDFTDIFLREVLGAR